LSLAIVAGAACAAFLGSALWRQQQELRELQASSAKKKRSRKTEGRQDGTHSSENAPEPDHGASGDFTPHHITATKEDMNGNGKVGGRYFLLPGSNGRAVVMASLLQDVTVRKSGRGHDVHLGQLEGIDVGICATGMGCPSVDIVVTELIKLGASRFLRVGTAGSLQPHVMRVGDLVVATAAVRDEGTSRHYAPLEFPAVASNFMVQALQQAAKECIDDFHVASSSDDEPQPLASRTFCGVIHTKDSLYAREFGEGAMLGQHKRYMRLLKRLGVLASEMEASHLFTLAHAQAHAHGDSGHGSSSSAITPIASAGTATVRNIECGAVLAVVGDDAPFADPVAQALAVKRAIALAMQGVRVMHRMEHSHRGRRSKAPQLEIPSDYASGDVCLSP